MSRRTDIALLLSSLNDDLPPLGTALHRGKTGFGPAKRRDCGDCGGSGWLTDSFKRQRPCQACGGTLEPRKPGTGRVAYDPMDVLARPVQTETQLAPPTRPPRMVRCDACDGSGWGRAHIDENGGTWREVCGYCRGEGKRTASPPPLTLQADDGAPVDKTTEAVQTRTDAGSYHELDQALAVLPGPWRKVLYDVHVNRLIDPEELCEVEAFRLEATMRLLEHVMPSAIRVPGAVRGNAKIRREHLRQVRGRVDAKALEKRDKEIRAMIRQGKPRQWVAAHFGLSVSQTYAIAPARRDAA